MDVPTNILQRIHKLLALATDPAAIGGEAANAMDKARALMERYDLSQAEIDAAKKADESCVAERESILRARRMGQSDEMLLHACCTLFDCRFYRSHGWDTVGYRIYGRKARIAVVESLWGSLRKDASKLGRMCFPGKSKKARKQREQFAYGFAVQVAMRAQDAVKAEQTTTGAGLVRVDELDQYAASLDLAASRHRKPPQKSQALSIGRYAGSKAHLGNDGLPDNDEEQQPLLENQ